MTTKLCLTVQKKIWQLITIINFECIVAAAVASVHMHDHDNNDNNTIMTMTAIGYLTAMFTRVCTYFPMISG